jgi:hypothetical protein
MFFCARFGAFGDRLYWPKNTSSVHCAILIRLLFFSDMQTDPLFFFRVVSGLALAGSILAGYLVFKNANRLFGVDSDVPSESASSRTYSKLLIIAVLIHAVVFFSAGLLFL